MVESLHGIHTKISRDPHKTYMAYVFCGATERLLVVSLTLVFVTASVFIAPAAT